jgi:hypothetical protein
MLSNKEAFVTSQRMLESPFGFGPTKYELELSTFLNYLMEVAQDFDRELVISVPHGIHQGLCHLSIASPAKSSSSQVESSSVK